METSRTKLSPQQKMARVRESYAALNAGDIENSLEPLSENIVFHSPVFPEPLSKDALRAAAKRILDTTDEYSVEVHDILANGDHIVALLVVHGRRGDRLLNERGVHVMHFSEDGMVGELWAIADPKPHLALWGDA